MTDKRINKIAKKHYHRWLGLHASRHDADPIVDAITEALAEQAKEPCAGCAMKNKALSLIKDEAYGMKQWGKAVDLANQGLMKSAALEGQEKPVLADTWGTERDPIVTCWFCKKTFRVDAMDAACRLCHRPFDQKRCAQFGFGPEGQEKPR